jgi:hypothetical protein
LNLPVPVFLKRLAAPRCVLSLGMVILLRNAGLRTGFSLQEGAGRRPDARSITPICVTPNNITAEADSSLYCSIWPWSVTMGGML